MSDTMVPCTGTVLGDVNRQRDVSVSASAFEKLWNLPADEDALIGLVVSLDATSRRPQLFLLASCGLERVRFGWVRVGSAERRWRDP